jgi:hypothetical protein
MSLEQAKQRYAGQWLAFLVTEETPTGELWVERAYVTFAGPVVKPGYAVIL